MTRKHKEQGHNLFLDAMIEYPVQQDLGMPRVSRVN